MRRSFQTCSWLAMGSLAWTLACHRRIAPPTPLFPGNGGPPTISTHCGRIADTAAEHAYRWQLAAWLGVAMTGATLVALPLAASAPSRETRLVEVSGFALAALSGLVLTRISRANANHHQAIAIGYAACADLGDDMLAYQIASEFYRLAKHAPLQPSDIADVLARVLRRAPSFNSIAPPAPPTSTHPPRPPPRDFYEVDLRSVDEPRVEWPFL